MGECSLTFGFEILKSGGIMKKFLAFAAFYGGICLVAGPVVATGILFVIIGLNLWLG